MMPKTYMAYVNITVLDHPEQIHWRIVHGITSEPVYAYTSNNSSHRSFLNLQSGVWRLEVTRESLQATARVEVGTLNVLTGATKVQGTVALGQSPEHTASTLFALS